MTEFIFPLIRRAAVPNSAGKAASSRSAASEKLAPLPGVLLTCPPEQRLKGVGSEWLFLKLYCGKDLQDDLIGGPLRYFARDALKEGFAEDWFFLRYSDPDPHIRLRFRGEAKVLTGKLLPVLCEWATWLMTKGSCLRYVFDTYDREIERYGGLAGMEVAEALFGADSQAVADFIALLQRHTLELERKLLAVLSTDDLLAALGASAPVRLGWYRQRVTERHQTGQAYRQKSSQLRALLSGSAQAVAALPGGAEVAAILAARREALALVAARLAALENEQGLARPLTTLYGSYVHMHCNRLLGTDRQAEEEVVGLLLRTQESLERAPVG